MHPDPTNLTTKLHPDTSDSTTLPQETFEATDTTGTELAVRPKPDPTVSPLVPSGIVTSSIIILSTPIYPSGEYYDNHLPGSSNRSVQCGEEIRLSIVNIMNI